MIYEKVEEYCLKVLMVVLPFHYIIFTIILDVSYLRLWKDILILFLFFAMIYRKTKFKISGLENMRIDIIDYLITAFVLIAIIYIGASSSWYNGLNIAKVYILPLLLIPILRNSNNVKDADKIIKYLIYVSCALAVYGIFQQVFLGDTFLINIGYNSNVNSGYPRLHHAFYLSGMGDFQRLTSVFVAPNTAGLYFSLTAIVLLFYRNKLGFHKFIYFLMIALLLLAVFMTFSRTAWISLFLGLIVYFSMMVSSKKEYIKVILLGALICIVAFVVLDAVIFGMKYSTIFSSLIIRTVTLQDTSVVGHINSLKKSIDITLSNPWGLGIGNNGPRALSYTANPNLTESSYFLMVFEVGIIGSVIYYAIYCSVLIKSKIVYQKNKLNRHAFSLIACIFTLLMVSYLSLPYIQEYELLVVCFFLIGYSLSLLYNPSTEE